MNLHEFSSQDSLTAARRREEGEAARKRRAEIKALRMERAVKQDENLPESIGTHPVRSKSELASFVTNHQEKIPSKKPEIPAEIELELQSALEEDILEEQDVQGHLYGEEVVIFQDPDFREDEAGDRAIFELHDDDELYETAPILVGGVHGYTEIVSLETESEAEAISAIRAELRTQAAFADYASTHEQFE